MSVWRNEAGPCRVALQFSCWLLLALTLLFSPQLPAQTPPPPVLIKEPAARMQWRMTILDTAEKDATKPDAPVEVAAQTGYDPAAAQSSAPKPIEVKYIDITKTGDLSRVTLTYNRGPKREIWQMAGHQLARSGNSSRIFVNRLASDVEAYAYASSGFYGIGNAAPSDDQGEVTFEGARCRYYRGKRALSALELSGMTPAQIQAAAITYEAWFEVATGLPRGYREAGKTFLFQFTTEPPADLALPREFLAAWEKYRLNLRRNGLAR